MAKVNLNKVAKFVAEVEGKNEEMSIAQIKEVLRITFEHHDLEEVVEIWQAYNK